MKLSLFPDGLPGDFQLVSHLGLWLEFIVLLHDVIVQQIQIWRVWRLLILFNEPRTVCLVLHDARMLRNEGCLC